MKKKTVENKPAESQIVMIRRPITEFKLNSLYQF